MISDYSVKKPITILMAVLIAIIVGFVSLTNLTVDLIPSINLPFAVVSTQYIGASPEQVELMVTKPFENSLATVSGLKNVTSVSSEHSSLIILEFNDDVNMDSALLEMRETLDLVMTYLPDEVNNPMIIKLNPDMFPIMQFSVAIEGESLVDATQTIEDSIVPRFERISGVAQVEVSGAAENEIAVTLNQNLIDEKLSEINDSVLKQVQDETLDALLASGIPKNIAETMLPEEIDPIEIEFTQDMIQGLLMGQNFSMPSGYVNQDNTEYLVRIGDKFNDLDELKEAVIISSDLFEVRLNEIADIEIVDTSEDVYSKVNGEQAIILGIQKQNNYATTDVAREVLDEITSILDENEDVKIEMLMDQAEYINIAVGSVINNLLYGALLAVVVLLVFLRDLKPTFIIGVAIPISVMTAFLMIYFTGITLNMISMGGLALGIGMLVDNSIVVIENIYRLIGQGKSAKSAAIEGAKQVSGAITASTLTTVAVFIPVVFMEGFTADIFIEMALTITFSLLASLLIALTVVPAMSAKMLAGDKNEEKSEMHKFKGFYTKLLNGAFKHKFIIILLTFVLFGGSIYGAYTRGTEFFPAGDEGQIIISLEFEKGLEFEEQVIIVDELVEDVLKINDVETISASMGGSGIQSAFAGGSTVSVLLRDDREKTTSQVVEELRMIESKADLIVTEQNSSMGAFGSDGIEIKVTGTELDVLESIANDITEIVESVEGTIDSDNGVVKTAPELKVTVNKATGMEYSITNAQVFGAINDLLNNDSFTTTLTLKGKDIDVSVYDVLEEQVTVDDINDLTIESPLGGEVDLNEIADITYESGFGSINRENQSRVITVTAAIEDGYNVGLVSEEVQSILDDYEVEEGYIVEMQGAEAEINEALYQLTLALVLAIVLIYMIMASQFQSLVYPFIVMFTLPLAFTGGFAALYITQTPISVVAFIGLIILAGVVVNNGIVLIDYINQLKDQGLSTKDAAIEAGQTRLRPIIMTALTTILALTTMALGIGEGSEMMQPMAITAIGGLVYATILTLVIIPVVYVGVDRMKEMTSNLVRRNK
jgi:HAE1 family hydrophobic/amphiphilic exporter-1